MKTPSCRERIAAQLADLKMPGALEALDEILAGVDGGGTTAAEAIERLLAAQIALRNIRRLHDGDAFQPASGGQDARRLRLQLPANREQIDSLHELGFVERRENVVFLGPPGGGKAHLAISLAITAAESGRKVYYGTLIDSLEEAQAAGRLNQRLKALTHPALLIVDEIGYLPVTRTGAILFFPLVNRRYEHASTVLTSNQGSERWGEILHDEVMAAALLDRLLHRCHIVNIRGNSYRMRRHVELSKAIHPTAARALSAERARPAPVAPLSPRRGPPKCQIFDGQNVRFSAAIDTGAACGQEGPDRGVVGGRTEAPVLWRSCALAAAAFRRGPTNPLRKSGGTQKGFGGVAGKADRRWLLGDLMVDLDRPPSRRTASSAP